MERKIRYILSLAILGAFILGFIFGEMFTHYNYFMLLEHINFNDIIVTMNETKMVEAMMPYIQ